MNKIKRKSQYAPSRGSESVLIRAPSEREAVTGIPSVVTFGAEGGYWHIPARREPAMKRPLDVGLSLLMLVCSAPVWALVALAIKLEDGGPVFYRQRRWGRSGGEFSVRKFRTMVADADQRFGPRQAREGDDRVTGVGRVLRSWGVDELPQLISIFLGEMSFVGPRALAIGERDADGNPLHYERVAGFVERLAVRPGLTGIATVYLPKDAPVHRKFHVDRLYIRRQSFWLDVRLIMASFWISFRGNWETRERKL